MTYDQLIAQADAAIASLPDPRPADASPAWDTPIGTIVNIIEGTLANLAKEYGLDGEDIWTLNHAVWTALLSRKQIWIAGENTLVRAIVHSADRLSADKQKSLIVALSELIEDVSIYQNKDRRTESV